MPLDVARTFGALLVGCIVAAILSGVVTVQCFIYFNCYPGDPPRIRLLVLSVWFLDLFHLFCVSACQWHYLILNFGDYSNIDRIPWSLALSIASTAVLTFLVHCFFVHRLFKLSGRKWWIAVPMAILAALRLGFACLTTTKMLALGSIRQFNRQYRWSFTSGLALSSILDVLITACLCYFLLRNRTQTKSMNRIIDSLLLYAFKNGSLTCTATIMSMICWLTMPRNLVFMGIHFFISKLYANSLLATLNTRNALKRGPQCDEDSTPPDFVDDLRSVGSTNRKSVHARPSNCGGQRPTRNSVALRINVERTVECSVSFDELEEGCSTPSTVCHTPVSSSLPTHKRYSAISR